MRDSGSEPATDNEPQALAADNRQQVRGRPMSGQPPTAGNDNGDRTAAAPDRPRKARSSATNEQDTAPEPAATGEKARPELDGITSVARGRIPAAKASVGEDKPQRLAANNAQPQPPAADSDRASKSSRANDGPETKSPANSESAAPAQKPAATPASDPSETQSPKDAASGDTNATAVKKSKPTTKDSKPPPATRKPTRLAGSAHVSRAQLTSGIRHKEPVDRVKGVFHSERKPLRRLYYFTEIKGLRGETVTHNWWHDGRRVAQVSSYIGSNSWRMYSGKKLIPSMVGRWRVVVTDNRGKTLSVARFTYKSP